MRQVPRGTVTVKTLGAGGEVPVPGMEAIALPAGGVITIGVPIPLPSVTSLIVDRRSGSSSSDCCHALRICAAVPARSPCPADRVQDW
jgi:hypothetical protein